MTTSASWQVWSTVAEVAVVDPGDLPRLRHIAEQTVDDVDRACSRFRADSEIAALAPHLESGGQVSEVLARIVGDALVGARLTDGLVDPTLGTLLHQLGWVAAGSAPTPLSIASRATWRDVTLDERTLTAPAGVRFDFGSTGKATTSDLIIERACDSGIRAGALVSLGGDIATSPQGPSGGWVITVQDMPQDPLERVALTGGAAIATSSTRHRRLPVGGAATSHILDPRSGHPAADTWGAATCIAGSCAHANSAATAAIVLGSTGPSWLEARQIPARLVTSSGDVVRTQRWPSVKEHAHV